jgi:hypothetical protein
MDEMILQTILRKISIFASTIGMLVGLDLLLGAKTILFFKNILDRIFNVDKIIIKVSSFFRKTLDKEFYFDQLITKTKLRIFLGVLFLIISALMISFVMTKR